MKVLCVDLETTGKADFTRAPDHDRQPRIVQLAALLCDSAGKEVASLNLVIRTSVDIPQEASAIHGITNVYAKEYGVPLFYALQVFWHLAKHADTFVAHNIEFDLFVLTGESIRMITDFVSRGTFCTMKAMTPICKLPGKYEGDYKWPRLTEAYRHAFNKDFDGAHDALADVRACKEIYFWLKNQPTPIPPAMPALPPTVLKLADEMRKAAG